MTSLPHVLQFPLDDVCQSRKWIPFNIICGIQCVLFSYAISIYY